MPSSPAPIAPDPAAPRRLWLPGSRGVAAIALLLVACVLGTAYAVVSARREVRAEAAAAHLTQALAASLADQVSAAVEAAGLVLADQRSRAAAGEAAQLPPELAGLLRDMPQLRAMLLTDAAGQVVAASLPMLVGRPLGGFDWFDDLQPDPLRPGGQGPGPDSTAGDFTLVPPQPGRYLDGASHPDPWQRWTLPLAAPLLGPAGQFAGAAIALLNPDYLTVIAARPARAFGVAIRLYDVEGRLVAQAEGGNQGIGRITPDNWLFREPLSRRALGSFSGTDLRGQPVTASFAVSRQAPLVVEVAQDRSVVLEPAREQDRISLAASIVVLAIAAGALWLLLRQGQRLAASEAMAQSASRAKADFLATMSHEIRTPMNGVIGLSDLLLETPLGPLQRRYAETIQSSAGHLMAVLNDILDFSKLEAGEIGREAVDFAPEEQLAAILGLMAPRAAARNVELLGEVDAALPGLVAGDLLRFRQILLNLLDNAVKFTERGWIRVALAAEPLAGGGWRMRGTVSDTGIGLNPAQVPMLFERFTQADASTSRRYGGTGLGLAIARRLVELLGGSIAAQPRPGGGAEFRFDICVAAPLAPLAAAARPDPRLQDLPVLVVEPSRLQREAVLAQLALLGARGLGVADAAAARQLAGPAPAVAILGGGLDTAAALRPMPAGWAPQLIQLQGAGDPAEPAPRPGDDRTGADPEGADPLGADPEGDDRTARFAAQLAKPVLPGALRQALQQALDAAPTGLPAPAIALPESPAPGRVVLLVEDNAVNQLVLTHVLQRAGLAVVPAGDGAQAVARAGETRFDAILMDMQMPVMDGLDATRAIRAAPGPNRATRIIGLTAAVGALYERQCREAGMDDYLTKPVDKARLLAAIGAGAGA